MATVMVLNASIATFHFSTLEEYYTGGLFLGPGNGISDGSLVIYILFIIMGMFGNEFWLWKIIDGSQPNEALRVVDLLVVGLTFSQVVAYLLCLKSVFDHQKKDLQPGDPTGEPLIMSHLLLQVIGYFLPMAALTSLLHIGTHPLIS
jgi:hypothetical protein